ncbi:hypothetical protein [Actinomycetospora soli]|uniref:hypothetical protein n=1 Tax=Actinomycetospora soli TaxID=2893887 RepID=UPI001E53FF07|nr:hypothetical protein [Actinomycetospora soli]MCD2188448.1 hypothetical protein [Actinomycetospora soli]
MKRAEAEEDTVTATRTVPPVAVIRPGLPRTPFADALADWLREGIAARSGPTPHDRRGTPVVVIVPEYLRGAPRSLIAALADRRWAGRPVGLVGYAGRTRARHALADAREVLGTRGAEVVEPSLGLDVARWRTTGFDRADVVLRDLLLDDLLAHDT